MVAGGAAAEMMVAADERKYTEYKEHDLNLPSEWCFTLGDRCCAWMTLVHHMDYYYIPEYTRLPMYF